MFKVTFINREPRKTGFSIEGIFILIKSCLKNRIEIGNYDMDPGRSWLGNILRVRKSAGDINHLTGDVNFLLLGVPGKRNILTVHDMGHYDTLRPKKLKHLIYHFFWFHFPLKNATLVTVVSQFTKNKLLEYFNYPESQIRIVYDPVKPIFQYSPKLQFNSKPRILQIGSGKHKNLTNLIEAVRQMSIHLDIVAFVPDETAVKLEEYKISYTIYNGLEDQEVYDLYVQSDLVFFASFYEGFGMPIIEAQAVGRPVITSNFGAMKEVAADSAYLVDPKNINEIKNAIQNILNNAEIYNQLVRDGFNNIKKFNHEKIAQDYLDIYNELIQFRN